MEKKKKKNQLMVQGKAPVRVMHGKREQHMDSGEGEETERQRKHRLETCGFYLTTFFILPRHTKNKFAFALMKGERDNKIRL